MRTQNPFTKQKLLRFLSPLTPYFAVWVGLYIIGNGWITFALYHAGLLLFILSSGQKHIFSKLLIGWNIQAAILSGLACSLVAPLLLLLWPYISSNPDHFSDQLGRLGLHGSGWMIFTFIFVIVNPIMEEVFWRGFLDSREKFPWMTDLIFAGYHLPVLAFFIRLEYLIIALISVTFAGWFWRWLARKYNGLCVPLASHIAADLFIVIAVQIIAR